MEPPPESGDSDRKGPWDGLLAGPENELALAAARELAKGEDEISPLVILGPSGSGKTRLLEGLVADRIARRPGASVAMVTGEAFADTCHRAAGLNSPAAWADLRDQFRGVDLLAIDDLHGISRSPLALSELGPTLDDLDSSGGSVAVSFRDAPGRWEGWPRRLADRLRVGLTVRIIPPGPATRRRYVMERVRSLGLTASSEAIDALAEASDGYRTIDGWVARLALTSRIDRRPLDLALASRLIQDEEEATPEVTIGEITRVVARQFGLHPRDLRSKNRRASLVEARHLAILIARELTGASYARIGKALGGRDPKTVRHACLAASDRLEKDPALASVAEAIRRTWHRDNRGGGSA